MKNRLVFIVTLLILTVGVIDVVIAQDRVGASKNEVKKSPEPKSLPTKSREDFLNEVEKLHSRVRTLDRSEEKEELVKEIDALINKLKENLGKGMSTLDKGDANVNQGKIDGLNRRYSDLQSKALDVGDVDPKPSASPITSPTQTNNRNDKVTETDWTEWVWYILSWTAIIIPIIAIIAGLYWIVSKFVSETNNELSRLRAGLSDARIKSNTLGEKIETISQAITGLSQQVTQQKTEINKLKQSVADQSVGSFEPPPPPIANSSKEAPRFPIAVTDYLAKFGGGANMVKYDYKEGILVLDPTGEGGMAIVQDEGQLFLVPSFGFFQTKSDYATYFERYFSCGKPGGGSVWIRQPAIVSKVDGGWAVTQNGELEVR